MSQPTSQLDNFFQFNPPVAASPVASRINPFAGLAAPRTPIVEPSARPTLASTLCNAKPVEVAANATSIVSQLASPAPSASLGTISMAPFGTSSVIGTPPAVTSNKSNQAPSSAPTQQSLVGPDRRGTASVAFKPYEEVGHDEQGHMMKCQHQSVVFQEPCRKFSPEELRLADYSNGLNPKYEKTPANMVRSSKGSGTVSLPTINPFMTADRRLHLKLMQGPGIDVIVGPELDGVSGTSTPCVWSLPKTLLLHHTTSLKNFCNAHILAVPEPCIMLPKEEPVTFNLFVEWMYYGTYTLDAAMFTSMSPGVSIDAQAWVLSDTLGATEFKNYVMNRLYDQYARTFAPRPITTADIEYIFTQSAADSKLRSLYLDLLVLHFKDTRRVAGDIAEWDHVMQTHPRVRMCLLTSMRSGKSETKMHPKEAYMEKREAVAVKSIGAATSAQVVPAKRDQDGVAVKKDTTDA